MKVTNVLMALTASAMLMTGCMSQKDPAENAVTQAEAAMTDLRVDAAKFAPEELKTTETTLAKMKDKLAKEDYKDVIAEVPPEEGTMLVFKNQPNAWHGFHAFEGPRRVIQLNWVTDMGVVKREQFRHRERARADE